MPYTLTIRERNHSWAGRSPVTTTHATLAAAEDELLAYVLRNWDAEVGADRPDDPQAMISEYFEEVFEAYKITEGATTPVANA